MMAAAQLSRLIGLIYAAAEEPELWTEFLLESATILGANASSLAMVDREGSQSANLTVAHADPANVREYNQHWASRDALLVHPDRSKDPLQPGIVVVSQQILPDQDLTKTEFYNDFLRRIDATQWLGTMLRTETSFAAYLIHYYGRKDGPRTEAQVQLMQLLAPHAARSLQLHKRLVGSEMTETGLSESLERLETGFLVLDEDGRIIRMNRTAELMLQRQDGLMQCNFQLTASTRHDSRLDFLIRGCTRTTMQRGCSSGGVMRIGRPSGKSAYVVTVMPVSTRGALFTRFGGASVVLITDPEARPVPPIAHIRALFGLTASEAQVALLLISGLDRQTIADRLCVSLNTIRTHLSNLFTKTETTTQAALVATLLTVLRAVPDFGVPHGKHQNARALPNQ